MQEKVAVREADHRHPRRERHGHLHPGHSQVFERSIHDADIRCDWLVDVYGFIELGVQVSPLRKWCRYLTGVTAVTVLLAPAGCSVKFTFSPTLTSFSRFGGSALNVIVIAGQWIDAIA